jgi:hypothetical protein
MLIKAGEEYTRKNPNIEPTDVELQNLRGAEMILSPVKSMMPVRTFCKSRIRTLPHSLQGMQKYSSKLGSQSTLQGEVPAPLSISSNLQADKLFNFPPGAILIYKDKSSVFFGRALSSLTPGASEIACNGYEQKDSSHVYELNETTIITVAKDDLLGQWEKYPSNTKTNAIHVTKYEMKTIKHALELPSYAESNFVLNAKCNVCEVVNRLDLIFCEICSSAFHETCLATPLSPAEQYVCMKCERVEKEREEEYDAKMKERNEAVRMPASSLGKRVSKPNSKYLDD